MDRWIRVLSVRFSTRGLEFQVLEFRVQETPNPNTKPWVQGN